jgi:anti-sigma B factor antagonist
MSSTQGDEQREISDGTLLLQIVRDGDVLRIALAGELDLANAGTAEGEIDAALATDGTEVVVDMRELEFIDSTGIALLVATLGRNEGERARIRFIPSTSPAVSRVLELTGLAERLPLAEA